MIFFEPPADFKPWFEVSAGLCEFDGKILLLKRLAGKSEGGKWGAAGGKMDKGETIIQGLKREMQEETGIQFNEDQIIKKQTFLVRAGEKDLVYHLHRLAFTLKPPVQLNPLEHDDYKWMSIEEALVQSLVHDMPECIHYVYDLK